MGAGTAGAGKGRSDAREMVDLTAYTPSPLELLHAEVSNWLEALSSPKSTTLDTVEGCLSVVHTCSSTVPLLAREPPDRADLANQVLVKLGQAAAKVWEASSVERRQHVARVIGGVGLAIYGVAFELADGARLGEFLDDSGRPVDVWDEVGLLRRHATGQPVPPGEHIVEVRGHNAGTAGCYLAWSIECITNTGIVLSFTPKDTTRRGQWYSFKAPDGQQVESVQFEESGCTGIRCWPAPMNRQAAETVREACKSQLEPLLRALGETSAARSAAEARYAWLLAAELEMGHLSCFDGLRDRNFASVSLPSHWDTTYMAAMKVRADCGLHSSDPADRNLFSRVRLTEGELAVFQAQWQGA